MNCKRVVGVLLTLVLAVLIIGPSAFAQSTQSTGSIQGIVIDPQGAVVPDAKITVTSKATGQVSSVSISSSASFTTGQLNPGIYALRVEAPGFQTALITLQVQVGVVTTNNVTLVVGAATTVVEVTSEETRVNTDQTTIQNVLSGDQIDNLPVNGRNFLDLAQMEPGVQMQDGTSFDPTKAGYSSVSINGVFGRTPRIEVDGLDVSDETVGTTTQNIPMSAIQEFNISRSSLDLSTEVTSSGAINLATRSGTNAFHGEAFGAF